MVHSGPLANSTIIFFDELRWGLGPALAAECLRRAGSTQLSRHEQGALREAIQERSATP